MGEWAVSDPVQPVAIIGLPPLQLGLVPDGIIDDADRMGLAGLFYVAGANSPAAPSESVIDLVAIPFGGGAYRTPRRRGPFLAMTIADSIEDEDEMMVVM